MSNTKQITLALLSIFCIIFGILFLFSREYWVSVGLMSAGTFCVFFLVKGVQRIVNQDVMNNVSRETSVKIDEK